MALVRGKRVSACCRAGWVEVCSPSHCLSSVSLVWREVSPLRTAAGPQENRRFQQHGQPPALGRLSLWGQARFAFRLSDAHSLKVSLPAPLQEGEQTDED